MLVVYEMYVSVQGESTHTGRPCAFVRLSACDLRCTWCDTPYAFTGGKKMSVDEVVAEVEKLRCPLVEITGGEPLLQADVIPLMERLIAAGHEVLSRPAVICRSTNCLRMSWPSWTSSAPAAGKPPGCTGRTSTPSARTTK